MKKHTSWTSWRSLLLFALGAVSMLPVVAYARHRRRREELGGVMVPTEQIYTPGSGTVDDAELIENPQHPETVILPRP